MSRAFGFSRRARVILHLKRVAGFTLLEVLIVIAIIVGLFAISFGVVRGAKERAAIARAKSELALLANALEEFKRHYGDYPQSDTSGASDGSHTLFNALTGSYGPRGAEGGVLSGPNFVELSKFSLERTPVPASSAIAADNAFVDPWGSRYFYFYKSSGVSSSWIPLAPVLFSSGPDGESAALPNASGVFPADAQFGGANADNIFADKLLQ